MPRLLTHPFIYRAAQFSFWIIMTSVLVGVFVLLSYIFDVPLMYDGVGCETYFSTSEIIVVPMVRVQCGGFVFAENVQETLKIVVNLEPILIMESILLVAIVSQTLFSPLSDSGMPLGFWCSLLVSW